MSFDWTPYASSSGEFVKFDSLGDSVTGVITAIRTHTFDADKGPTPLIDLKLEDGTEVTLSVNKVDLRQKLSKAEPQHGDQLFVRYEGNEKTPSGTTKKVFNVRVKPALTARGEEPF